MTTIQKIEDLTSKVNRRNGRLGEARTKLNHCQNPWNPHCKSPDIELYIVHEGRKIPICWSCWQKIAETDLEW